MVLLLSWQCSIGMPPELIIGQVPPATQGLVEIDDRNQLRLLHLRELVLGGEELLLGLDHLEITGSARVIAFEGEIDRLAKSDDLGLQRRAAFGRSIKSSPSR